MPKISIDTPLSEITLRRYEKPSTSGRDLIRKLCLSLGVLQPGDSRDVIVDILEILIKSNKQKKFLTASDIEKQVIDSRKKQKLELKGIASSNIRRQIKRLRDIFLIEKIKNQYRLNEFSTLKEILEDKIMKYHVSSIQERIYEYCEKIDDN